MTNSNGLARAAKTLDTTGLVDRQTSGGFGRRQCHEPPIGTPTNQKRTADYSMRVTVNEVVRRVPVKYIDTGDRVRTRKYL